MTKTGNQVDPVAYAQRDNQALIKAAAIPTQMRAAVRTRYGPTNTIRTTTVDTPSPEPEEVLVEVHAAGVDRGVWHLLTGLPYLVRLAGFGLTRPRQPVLGHDVAGRVVAVGRAVTGLQLGDAVFGVGSGTFAEYARARHDHVVPIPTGLEFAAAAAAPTSGLAAWQAVHDVAVVRSGQRVLVLGASGGVGTFCVQLAVAVGAEVTGVASRSKLDLVTDLGAAHIVDYTSADPCTPKAHYDVIIDVGGGTSLARLRRALTPRGTLVIVGGENGGRWTGGVGRQLRAAALSPWVGQRLTSFISSPSSERLTQLSHALAGGLTPAIGRTYALDDSAAALDDLVAGRVRGKAIVSLRG